MPNNGLFSNDIKLSIRCCTSDLLNNWIVSMVSGDKEYDGAVSFLLSLAAPDPKKRVW